MNYFLKAAYLFILIFFFFQEKRYYLSVKIWQNQVQKKRRTVLTLVSVMKLEVSHLYIHQSTHS